MAGDNSRQNPVVGQWINVKLAEWGRVTRGADGPRKDSRGCMASSIRPASLGNTLSVSHVNGSVAVDLAAYGVEIPAEFEFRAAQAELLKVRRGIFRGRPWLPRWQGCQGQIVHGGLHPRHGPLQPGVFQQGQGDCRKCGSCAWRASTAKQRHWSWSWSTCSGVCGGRSAGAHSDACFLFPARFPADATSGGE